MTTAQLTSRRNAALARSASDPADVTEAPVVGEWMVRSSTKPSRWYIVDSAYRCTCAAGQLGQPCDHAARVYRVRHNLGRTRVTVRS